LFVPVHGVLSGWFVCAEQTPVPAAHVPGTWHASVAVHITEFVPVQTPPMHAYESHLFGPLHAALSAFTVWAAHVPVPGLHEPATWQSSVAGGHMTGLDPVHIPAWQV
jgi:hypothetical protein